MLVSMVENTRLEEVLRTEAIPVWIPITEVGFPDIPSLAKLEQLCRMSSFNRTAFATYAVIAPDGRVLGFPDCREYDYSKPLHPAMMQILLRQLEAIRAETEAGDETHLALERQRSAEHTSELQSQS